MAVGCTPHVDGVPFRERLGTPAVRRPGHDVNVG
jgi:hypothetical protein